MNGISVQTLARGEGLGKFVNVPIFYPSRRPASRPFARKIFPGRCDRRAAVPPASAPRPTRPGDSTALGLLVLLLSARSHELPAQEARRGWRLAQDWLAAFVAARHAEVAA